MIIRLLSLVVVPFLCAVLVFAQPPTSPPGQGKPPEGTKPDGGGKPPVMPGKPPEPPKGKPVTPPGQTHEPKAKAPTPVSPEPPVKPPGGASGDPPPITNVDSPAAPTPHGLVGPTQPATFAQRAIYSYDNAFNGRVTMAVMSVVVDVYSEPETTPEHARRLKYAGHVMREPDMHGRKMARLLAVLVPVTADSRGYTTTTATDAQLRALLAQQWTAQALAMGDIW